MTTLPARVTFQPDPDTLYLGDNGRCACGDHLGVTATMTGYDLSGQPLMAIDAAVIEADETAADLTCATCGKGVAPDLCRYCGLFCSSLTHPHGDQMAVTLPFQVAETCFNPFGLFDFRAWTRWAYNDEPYPKGFVPRPQSKRLFGVSTIGNLQHFQPVLVWAAAPDDAITFLFNHIAPEDHRFIDSIVCDPIQSVDIIPRRILVA